MSETLYRKYRPKKFDDVIGQEQIVATLQNALKSDRVAHSYIFAGSRGTGKTTLARIFASALGVSQNDLYEIDAASNRNIDDIRAIRDAVSTLPFDSKFKIYLLDEVHMLTKESWNALLKTLEEPPSHVIFIMATTEIEKIPDTILSRSELHTFKKPDDAVLAKLVKQTAKKEGFAIDDEAAEVLAMLADGSFRDAHGNLQKIISSLSGKSIKIEDVEAISGAPKIALVADLIDSILNKDIVKAISVIAELRKENRDIKVFTKLVLEKVRSILIARIKGELGVGDNKAINSETLIAFLDAYEKISRSSFPDIALEAALLKMLG
ncbi:MAG: DNA polymerase III subunit gamma/tau [Patescibacteria group bacterium]